MQCGRVGSRLLLSGSLDYESSRGFFCHADFADDADFFFAAFLFPTDFTDFRPIRSGMTQILDLFGLDDADI